MFGISKVLESLLLLAPKYFSGRKFLCFSNMADDDVTGGPAQCMAKLPSATS